MAKLNSEDRVRLNRRQLFLPATAGLGAVLGSRAQASDSVKPPAHQAPGGCSTPRSAVAKTQYGNVRGYVNGGVLTFKGVPYGQIFCSNDPIAMGAMTAILDAGLRIPEDVCIIGGGNVRYAS